MPDRSEWDQFIREHPTTPPPLLHPRFAEHLRLVAARIEHLQDSDEWAAYRAQLETLIEETEGQIRVLERAITDGDTMGDELFRQRLRLARLRGRQDGYRDALDAPRVVSETKQKLVAESL